MSRPTRGSGNRPIIYAWQARRKCLECGKLYPDGAYYHMDCMSCRVCGVKKVAMREGYCRGCHPDPDDPWIRRVVPWPDDPLRNFPMWLYDNDKEDQPDTEVVVAADRAREEAGVFVRVKSYTMQLYTRLGSELTVGAHTEKLAVRFPEHVSEYRLFLEDDTTYILLHPADKLGDFDAWVEGAKLRYMRKSWQGSNTKRVVASPLEWKENVSLMP